MLTKQITVPERQWTIYNSKILHGVENSSSNRIALQIGLNTTELCYLLSKHTQ